MKRTEKDRRAFLALRANEMRQYPTAAERVLRNLLQPLGFRFQAPMTGRTKNGGEYDYILDAYHDGAKLAVEADGAHHQGRSKGRDRRRSSRLVFAHGIRVLRFSNAEILNPANHKAILKRIEEALASDGRGAPP
jgi:very-short-patch-repair endonuclease